MKNTKKQLEEDNYLIIDNFIPPEEANFFYQQFKIEW
jgi:hypothetical protein